MICRIITNITNLHLYSRLNWLYTNIINSNTGKNTVLSSVVDDYLIVKVYGIWAVVCCEGELEVEVAWVNFKAAFVLSDVPFPCFLFGLPVSVLIIRTGYFQCS